MKRIAPHILKLKLIFVLILLELFSISFLKAATRYSVANGNWNSTSTWAATSGGTAGASVPVSGDDVIIESGYTVTVNITNAACNSLTLGGGRRFGYQTRTGTLTFVTTGSPVLAVSGNVQVGGTTDNASNGTITFISGASMTAGSLAMGNTTTTSSSTLTMTDGGTLTLNGAFTVSGSGTKTWTPGTGTVIMNATNTLPATVFTTFNNLTCGSGTTTTGANLAIGGNLNISNGSTFTTTAFNLTVTGVTTVGGGTSGTLNISAYNGTKIFTGLVTINSGGIWDNSSTSSPVTFRGGITNHGTFTPGNTYRYTFDTNAQSLNGTINMAGATVIVTGINLTNNGTLTIASNFEGTGTLTNAATGILNIGSSVYTSIATLNNQGMLNLTSTGGIGTATANFTNTGTINLNGSAYITGITNNDVGTVNFLNASQTIGAFNNATATSVLNISALFSSADAITTLTATVAGNTVNYSGTGNQTVKNTTYSNLIISGSETKTLAGATTINAVLTLNGGTLSSGATTGNQLTGGTLDVENNSTITLGSGVHTLNFANSNGTWAGTTLTITGWTGTAGSTGTAGRIYFGNDITGLSASQLAKISFSGFGTGAQLLSSGELVPITTDPYFTVNPTSIDFGYVASGNTDSETFTLTGLNLNGSDVTLTGNSIFQLSIDGSTFSNSVTISGYGSSISQPIYVQFGPTTADTNYNLTITISGGGASSNIAVSGTSILNCTATGTILMERWDGIAGTIVANLTGNANYPENPTSSNQLSSFEIPTNVADDYGVRVRGYICAPATGNYIFWIASDDNSDLYLSTDDDPANMSRIAYHTDWTNSREWNKFGTQKSAAIPLVFGQQYYVEALMKEGGGGDNLAVGWAKPGEGTTIPSEVIPGTVLSPFIEPVTGIVVTPSNTSVAIGYTSPLTATVSPNNAANKNVTWSSSNNSIATVNASGVVTGVAVGSVTITATTVDGGFTDDCSVTVTATPVCITSQPNSVTICAGNVTSFSINTAGTVTGRRWWVSTNGGANWTAIFGAIAGHPTYTNPATNTLTITNTTTAHSGFMYRCITTGCVETSNTATLNVGIDKYGPQLSVSEQLLVTGESTTLSLSNTQVGLNYQLFAAGSPTGSPVAGNGGTISFAPVSPISSTNYTVSATSQSSACTSDMIDQLTVIVNVDDLIIELNPCAGQPGANFFTNSEFGNISNNYYQTPNQTNLPGVIFGNPLGATYTYYNYGVDGGDEVPDGNYVIANSTAGMYRYPDANDIWLLLEDQYDPGNGFMYIINADYDPGEFYTETLTNLCDSTKYEFSADIINLYETNYAPQGTDFEDWFPTDDQGNRYSILPNIDFLINGKVAFNTGNIPNDGNWRTVGFTFRSGGLPNITLTMRNNATGGIGNDIALDNIVMRPCGPDIELNITTVPAIVCPGEPVTMTGVILASDYNSPVYQWQKSTDGGNSWINISGFTVESNSTTYVETNPVFGNQYRFITGETIESLTNPNCFVSSNVITIETTADILSTTPAIICGSGSMNLGATSNAGATIRWYSDAGGTNQVGTDQIGTSTYTTPDLSETTSYYVRASKDGCIGPLIEVIATVYPSEVSPSVLIDVSPGANICTGNTVTFTATPTNGGTAPLYQWRKNGANISGATNSTYTTNTLVNNDLITCFLTENPNNACITGDPGTAISNPITMVVGSMPVSVSIAASPGNSVCIGSLVTFTATPVNGGLIPSYQWKLNGSNVGTNSPTYSTSTLADNDQVSCMLTSSFTCATNNPATSNTITMTVNPLPTITTTGTIDQVRSSTSSQTTGLEYTATSQSPTSYAIDWDATANAAGLTDQGTTAFSFAGGGGTITGIVISANVPEGNYSGTMTITNANGCSATQAISITVLPMTIIDTHPEPLTLCEGGNGSFTVISTELTATFQWQYSTDLIIWVNTDGVAGVSGHTTDELTITGAPLAYNNFYIWCLVTEGSFTEESTPALLTVNPNAVITLTSAAGTDDQTVCLGDAITNITYSISGGGTGADVGINDLPAGVTGVFNSGSFTISGTSSEYGVFNYTVTTTGTCQQTTAQGTITVNSPFVSISTDYVEDCPHLISTQGFNPENGLYDAGATLVNFTITINGTTATNWNFDYIIEDAVVRTAPLPYPSPNPQSGTNIQVTGAGNTILTFYINNNPGNPLTPVLKITRVSDENNCEDITERSGTVNILAMPVVGAFD